MLKWVLLLLAAVYMGILIYRLRMVKKKRIGSCNDCTSCGSCGKNVKEE